MSPALEERQIPWSWEGNQLVIPATCPRAEKGHICIANSKSSFELVQVFQLSSQSTLGILVFFLKGQEVRLQFLSHPL